MEEEALEEEFGEAGTELLGEHGDPLTKAPKGAYARTCVFWCLLWLSGESDVSQASTNPRPTNQASTRTARTSSCLRTAASSWSRPSPTMCAALWCMLFGVSMSMCTYSLQTHFHQSLSVDGLTRYSITQYTPQDVLADTFLDEVSTLVYVYVYIRICIVCVSSTPRPAAEPWRAGWTSGLGSRTASKELVQIHA